MTILFSEPEHRYFCPEIPQKKFISVSGLFDLVKEKFDSVGQSEKYATKGKEVILKDLAKKWKLSLGEARAKWGHLQFTPEDIRAIWKEKADIGKARGTAWHKKVEEDLLKGGGKRGTKVVGEHTQAIDLSNLEAGDYIELIIPYFPAWLIGTADRVRINADKTFFIRDWKTDVELTYQGTAYFDLNTGSRKVRKLLPPLNHLDDVNGVGYNVKESLYILFLESHGYKFAGGIIDHVLFEGDEMVNIVEYPITYLKKEAQNLVRWYKEKYNP
jgi:hypothetical protein